MKYQTYTLGLYWEEQAYNLLRKIIREPKIFLKKLVLVTNPNCYKLLPGLFLKKIILDYLAIGDGILEGKKPLFPYDPHRAEEVTFDQITAMLSNYDNTLRDLILVFWILRQRKGERDFKKFFEVSLGEYWSALDQQCWPLLPPIDHDHVSPPSSRRKKTPVPV